MRDVRDERTDNVFKGIGTMPCPPSEPSDYGYRTQEDLAGRFVVLVHPLYGPELRRIA